MGQLRLGFLRDMTAENDLHKKKRGSIKSEDFIWVSHLLMASWEVTCKKYQHTSGRANGDGTTGERSASTLHNAHSLILDSDEAFDFYCPREES